MKYVRRLNLAALTLIFAKVRFGRMLLVLASVLAVLAVGAPPAESAFPGGNGKIVFQTNRDGNYEIYTMNADGTGQTRLTNNAAEDSAPAWSADGTRIAFHSNRDGNYEIYTMNANGTGQTRLTNNAAEDSQADWSPDGTKLVFRTDRDGNFEIYTMNATGTGQTRLTNNPALDRDPVWSPDGTKLAFGTNRDGNDEIYTMNATGTGPTNRTNNPAAGDLVPAWSPDGTKLAFRTDRDGGFEIYTMNANGTGQTRLTNNAALDSRPAWSPDGTKLAFDTNLDVDYEIYTMNAAGTGLTRLTNNAGLDLGPDWQPTCVNAPSGLVSCWRGEGNAIDIQDGNNGTLNNGATFAPGKVGLAFSLDGVDDYVELGQPANLMPSNSDFTVAGWFMVPDYPNNSPDPRCPPEYPIIGFDYGWDIGVRDSGRVSFVKYTIFEDAASDRVYSTSSISPNTFHHFAAVHAKSEMPMQMRIYVDGALAGAQDMPTGTVFYNPGPDTLQIGRRDCGIGRYNGKGLIDELAFYNRALTPNEILAMGAPKAAISSAGEYCISGVSTGVGWGWTAWVVTKPSPYTLVPYSGAVAGRTVGSSAGLIADAWVDSIDLNPVLNASKTSPDCFTVSVLPAANPLKASAFYLEVDGCPINYTPGGCNFNPTVTYVPPVGGTVELLAGGSGSPASASGGSGSPEVPYAALAGGAAAAVVALALSGWYVRRRWMR